MRYCLHVFWYHVSNFLCLPNSVDDQADQRLCLPPLIQVAVDNRCSRLEISVIIDINIQSAEAAEASFHLFHS